jgi:hypothetical protein
LEYLCLLFDEVQLAEEPVFFAAWFPVPEDGVMTFAISL